MPYGFTSTGFNERVDGQIDRIPEFDPRSGDHYWMMIVSYHIDPKTFGKDGLGLLDHESLVSTAGPVCYFCENPYNERVALRRCKGHP